MQRANLGTAVERLGFASAHASKYSL